MRLRKWPHWWNVPAGGPRTCNQMEYEKMAREINTEVTGTVLTISTSVGTIRVDASDLATEIRTMAMLHGLRQKICDAAAIARNTETGRSASITEKHAEMRAVADRLMDGQWNAKRESAESSENSIIIRAVAEVMNMSESDALAAYAKLAREQKTKLRSNPRVAAVIARIRAEMAQIRAANAPIDEADNELAALLGE